MATVKCQNCRKRVPGYDTVHYGAIETGYRDLCMRCYNTDVASRMGLEYEHIPLQPIDMDDAVGAGHRFHFRTRLLGDRVALEAFELVDGDPGGRQFQMLEDWPTDLFELLGRLTQRMRRSLAHRHLVTEEGRLQIADFVVRGQIDWDEQAEGRLPMLVIDGREVTWEQFGRLLMSFEGWQFKLEIRDRSEEV
jgi:hypothetical protein